MILQTDKSDYFLVRQAKLLDFERSKDSPNLGVFDLSLGSVLFLDPDRYREIVSKMRFSWFGRGIGRQLIHAAGKQYQKELTYMPIARGNMARFLFYNDIERRIRL